jgi:hypothetical protein
MHVLLINKDPSVARSVSVSIGENCGRGLAKVFSYQSDDTSLRTGTTRLRGSSFSLTLSPYSMSAVLLP